MQLLYVYTIACTFASTQMVQSDTNPTVAQLVEELHKHFIRYSKYSVSMKIFTVFNGKSRNSNVPDKEVKYTKLNNNIHYTVKYPLDIKNKNIKSTADTEHEYVLNDKYYLHLQPNNGKIDNSIVGGIIRNEDDLYLYKQRTMPAIGNSFLTLEFSGIDRDIYHIMSSKTTDCKLKVNPSSDVPYTLMLEEGSKLYEVHYDKKLFIQRIVISVNGFLTKDQETLALYKKYYGMSLSSRIEINLIATNHSAGNSLPSCIGSTITNVSEKRGTEISKRETYFFNLNLAPEINDSTFVPHIEIPNNTVVSIGSEQQIKYEWWNGEIVKKINRDTVVGLAQHQFHRGYLGYVLIAVVITCMLIITSFYVWKWRNTRGNA